MLINGNCFDVMEGMCNRHDAFDSVFADPPDSIGLKYDGFDDYIENYADYIFQLTSKAMFLSNVMWISFNSRNILDVAAAINELNRYNEFNLKPCVQTFTFGQNSQTDLSNCHRPLWRISRPEATFYPDAIRVPSWRQQNGDKRADPRGKVPSDVFDFPRVTGNSKQRRKWHKTQLHEGLVERCLKLTVKPGGNVLDPFAGTGTVSRVCKRLGFSCTSIEISDTYHSHLSDEMKEQA